MSEKNEIFENELKEQIKSFNIPVPENVFNKDKKIQENILNYFKSMDEKQKKAYIIAFNHLGTSFNIIKSNGYKEWLSKK